MWMTISMLATREGVSVATIGRILREMRESGNNPTIEKRCGSLKVDTEAFDHYINRRRRKHGKQD